MTEDIKLEEIHEEIKEASEDNKSFKKFHKMSDKLLKKINARINGERDSIRKSLDFSISKVDNNINDFIKNANEGINSFKKRYEAMYTDLVRRILVKMEGRLFSAELFEQASLDLLVEKIYRLENGLKPEDELDHISFQAYIEDCAAKHEKLMQKHADEFIKKQKESNESESVQKENKDKDTSGNENKSSDISNSEDSGATNKQDGGSSEQTSSKE
jgi:hypothetical protein